MDKNGVVSWPKPERALKAVLHALGLTKLVSSRVTSGSSAGAREFHRFLGGDFADTAKGDFMFSGTLDALLREVAGVGLDADPGLLHSLGDLEERYARLRERVPVMWASQDAIDWFVLSRLLVPWAAGLAAGCGERGLPLDLGMPGGRFWFLPTPRDGRVVSPLHQFFEWWRDLLGLQHRSELVARLEERLGWPNLEEEVAEWVSARADLPPLEKIGAFAVAGERLGRAADCRMLDEDGSLEERLARCVAFAHSRGLTPEALSLEIPTRARAIAEIVAAASERRRPRLPDDLLERFTVHMRQRWAAPTKAQLRSRLLVARGVQKLFMEWRKRFGEDKAFGLCGQFQTAYNVFMNLLPREPEDGERALRKVLEDPCSDPLRGILQLPGAPEFIDRAAAYVVGCPDRFTHDFLPVPDTDVRQAALYWARQHVFRLIDLSRELQLSVPDALTRCNGEPGSGVWKGEHRRFSRQVGELFAVLAEKTLPSLWLAYRLLPEDMPASAIHVLIAKKIVDTVGDLDGDAFWLPRFRTALARAQDVRLGPALEVTGLMLEGWWLTALHRPKRPGDAERLAELFRRLDDLEPALNGWFRFERVWRRGRFLAQAGRLKEAVACYEDIVKNGASNLSRGPGELAWEALAVASAAGKAGRFATILKHARRHNGWLGIMAEEEARKVATQTYEAEFVNSFPV